MKLQAVDSQHTLSVDEMHRYARHLAIPEFGMQGQEKLKSSSVLVVGAGGLGSPLLLYLAAAGVGRIGIIDYDVVELTNLQRQVLFKTGDAGKSKAQLAGALLQQMNPHIRITVYEEALQRNNALDIIEKFDIVADGSDNFPTRYLVNDACVLLGKPYVYASIFRFEGQLSVFNMPRSNGSRGPNYRDLFPEPPPPELVPNCAEGGVLGVLPGIIGCMQASEVIKVATKIGSPLDGRLFLFDAASFQTHIMKIPATSSVVITDLVDYEQFCMGVQRDVPQQMVREIAPEELAQWFSNGEVFQIVDVRENYEYQVSNLQGVNIPLKELEDKIACISREDKVVVHCRTGKRSSEAIVFLQSQFGFHNLYNLKGGLKAWAMEMDPGMVVV